MQLRQRSNGCALTLMPLAGWPWPWFLIFFGQFLFSQKCLPPFWWFSMFIGSKSNIGKIFWHFFSYKTWAWAELLARLRCCQLSPDCIANASKLEFDCLAGLSEWVWIPRRGAKRVAESFLHFRSKLLIVITVSDSIMWYQPSLRHRISQSVILWEWIGNLEQLDGSGKYYQLTLPTGRRMEPGEEGLVWSSKVAGFKRHRFEDCGKWDASHGLK